MEKGVFTEGVKKLLTIFLEDIIFAFWQEKHVFIPYHFRTILHFRQKISTKCYFCG